LPPMRRAEPTATFMDAAARQNDGRK